MGPCNNRPTMTRKGNRIHSRTPNTVVHDGCREGSRCDGPGCRITTGKTAAKRKYQSRDN